MIDIVYHGIKGKFMTELEYERLVEKVDEQSRLIEEFVIEMNR